MLTLLQTLVNTDSGSHDKAGVDAVGIHIQNFLRENGIAVEITPDEKFGDAIAATVAQDSPPLGNRPILLMGHRDTVFPKGEPSRRPFKIEGGRAYGPGVADMKSGLVLNCFVLAAIKKFGGAPAPVTALFTGDEEIGSPFSRPVIEQHARAARVCFNSEPGRAPGAAVTGRKGCLFIRFEIAGKAAHSGGELRGGHQRDQRARAQDLGAACAERAEQRHHAQCRRDFRRPDRQHHRAVGQGRGRPALHHAGPAQRHPGQGSGDHGEELRAGHQRADRDHRRVRAAGRERRGQGAVRALRGRSARAWRRRNGRAVHRRLRRLRASPRRLARRPSAPSVRSAGACIRPTSIWRSTR